MAEGRSSRISSGCEGNLEKQGLAATQISGMNGVAAEQPIAIKPRISF